MTGCIFKRKLKTGISWGYSFFLRRDETGHQERIFKSGFPTKGAADAACKAAITEYESTHGRIVRERESNGRRLWTVELGPTRITGITSEPAAQEALRVALKTRVDNAAAIEAAQRAQGELTFARYFEMWLTEHAARRLAPKTLERYRELGRYLMPHIGAVPLNELTTAAIQLAIHNLQDHGGSKTEKLPAGRPLAAKTVRHIGTLLYTALSEADRLGLMTIPNPMANKRVRLPKLPKRRPAVLDPEKLSVLFARARSTRLYPFVVVAADSGCRRGELLALTWEDFNPKTGELSITKSLEQTKDGLRVKGTKSGEARTFGISEWAVETLEEHRAAQQRDREMFGPDYSSHNLIFCQPAGGYYSPDRVGARVVELMRKAGLEGVSLHSLRHSSASIQLSNGVPISVVSERLGHADQNITLSIYSHALPADRRAASKIWQDAMADVVAASRESGKTGRLAQVCRKAPAKKLSDRRKRREVGGDDGVRTR